MQKTSFHQIINHKILRKYNKLQLKRASQYKVNHFNLSMSHIQACLTKLNCQLIKVTLCKQKQTFFTFDFPFGHKVCLIFHLYNLNLYGHERKKRDEFNGIYHTLFEDYKILPDLVSFRTD